MPTTPDQSPPDIPPLSPDVSRAGVTPDVGYVDRGAAVVSSGGVDGSRSSQRQRTVWGTTALSTAVESGREITAPVALSLEQEIAATSDTPDSTVSASETNFVDTEPFHAGTDVEQEGDGLRESANGNVPLRLGSVGSGTLALATSTDSKDTTGSTRAAKTEGGAEDGSNQEAGEGTEEGGDGPETDNPRHSETADDASVPPEAGDVPTDPPISPNAETGFPEPGRGRMLQQIADYGAVAGEAYRNARDELLEAAGGDAGQALAILHERGVSLDEAEEGSYELPPVLKLQAAVAASERQHAQLQYGGALEATGLELHSSLQGVEVRIADPARLAAALQEVEHPEDDAIAEENLASQTQVIIDEGLNRAAHATTMRYAGETRPTIFGDMPPVCAAYIEADEGLRASDEDIAFADALPDHAGTIAAEFERIDGHEATLEGIEQLDLAKRDNLVIEWGLGRDMKIIGDKDAFFGVDLTMGESEWGAVYKYLEHLQRTAPRAAFTLNVRDAVLRDIDAALSEVPMRRELEREITHGDDYSFLDEPDDHGASPQEELEGDSTIPNLRYARDRVRGIFGL